MWVRLCLGSLRNSASRGKLFYRLVQQAVQVSPATFNSITAPNP